MILSKYLSRDLMKILTANSYKSVPATIPSYSNCTYIKITYGNLREQKKKVIIYIFTLFQRRDSNVLYKRFLYCVS
jgi:hypothetical protein